VGVGLFGAVSDFGGQGERGGVLGVGLVELSVSVVGLAEAVEDLGLIGPVTDVAADREGLLMAVDGLRVTALLPMGEPEAVQHEGLADPETKASTQWLRSVERWLNPRDRVLALLPFYAGLRLGEAIALDLADVQLSARKGTVIVRSGKGSRYREIPTHPTLRDNLTIWIDDERPHWPSAKDTPALLLNRRGGRLSARAADQILGEIAKDAKIDEFTPHVLRHTFGTRLVRQGHDLVVVAELLGHARLDQTRRYSLPTQADRQRAINSLPTDH
jgi:integrase